MSGRAYLAIDWKHSEPLYIEAGNKFIPSTFYWGEFYRIPPGNYLLYYEGEYFNGRRWISYAWEVEYQIWVNQGEFGLPHGIDGLDGADVYFTIICSPGGPAKFFEEHYKSAQTNLPVNFDLIQNTGELIEIKQINQNFTLSIKYRKVQPKYTPAR